MGGGEEKEEGGVYSFRAWAYPRSPQDRRTAHACNAGTEHFGFSPTGQMSRALSAKRRKVLAASQVRRVARASY